MFGIIIGTVCLVGLIATVRARRFGRFAYAHGPWSSGGCGGHVGYEGAWAPRPWAPVGRRNLLRGLFARLDTTPGQEKAIVALLSEARARARDKRDELRASRREIAALIGSEVLDRAALEASFAGPRRTLDALQQELVTLLAGMHELLDDGQRRTLGELLADGSLGREPYFGC